MLDLVGSKCNVVKAQGVRVFLNTDDLGLFNKRNSFKTNDDKHSLRVQGDW